MAYIYQISEEEFNRIEQVNHSLYAYCAALDNKANMDYLEQSQVSLLNMLHENLDPVVRRLKEKGDKELLEVLKKIEKSA